MMKDKNGTPLKAGDIVTTYYKGFFKLTGSCCYVYGKDVYEFTQVLDTKGNTVKGKQVLGNHFRYIEKVDSDYVQKSVGKGQAQLDKKRDNLNKLVGITND